MSLEDILSAFPKSSFYIEVLHPGLSDRDSLFQIIKSASAEERVILTSPFINTTKTLRTAGYKWLTGASTAEASKARVMSSLYLETVADIPSDVLIVEKASSSPRLLAELQRRLKVALFIAEDPKDLPDNALAYARTGVLTTRPTLFKSSYAK
jgi:hypothetical protein